MGEQEYATDAHEDTIGQYNRIIAELDSAGDEADLDEFLLRLMRNGLVSDIYASKIDAYEEKLPEEQNEVVNEISKSVTDKPRGEVSVDDIQNSLRESVQSLRESASYDATFIGSVGSEPILTYFTTVVGVVEHRTSWIIHERFIEDEYKEDPKDSNNSETWELIRGVSGLNESQRERWLLRTGVIDEGLHGNLAAVRDMRNDIVHDPLAPAMVFASPDEIQEIGEKGLTAARELTEKMNEEVVDSTH